MKEFYVRRTATIGQAFTVKAETAAEAREILERVAGDEWAVEKARDGRVTYVSLPELENDPRLFVRTMAWADKQ